MKKLVKYIFLLVLLLIFSCEKKGLLVVCQDCTIDEPFETTLKVKLGGNDFNLSTTEIKLYEGNLEDNLLKNIYNTEMTYMEVTVSINKKYTLTATYSIDGKTYITVDSATPKVRYESEQCQDPCYFVYDRKIDLRLKYTK
jgi:hypothetical protein